MSHCPQCLSDFVDDPERIAVFGLIVYSRRHPYTLKMLTEDAFWDSLDLGSGRDWNIYTARVISGSKKTQSGNKQEMMSMMIAEWDEPEGNQAFLEELGLTNSEKPVFVLCAALRDSRWLTASISLSEESVDASYKRLNYVISSLTEAVARIDRENYADIESVFNAVNMTVSHIRTIDNIKKIPRLYKWIKEAIT